MTLRAPAHARTQQARPVDAVFDRGLGAGAGPRHHAGRLLQLIAPWYRARTAYLTCWWRTRWRCRSWCAWPARAAGWSSQLIRQPLLLDELLDPRRLYSPLHGDELRRELDAAGLGRDDDLEQEMERLRQFAQGNRLRVAAADIVGAIPS